jgi:CubicO group peptidase (beta-lactamase class C family)
LTDLAARPEMAGLAVAVVEDGKLSFVRTYGVADADSGAPVTPHTLFRWASVSKTATGALAAALSKDGAVNLDRPVASWHSSLRLPGGAESHVTLAELLAQRTGLTKNAYDEKLEEGQSPALLRTSLAGAPLQCEPGTCHTYQNVAFDTASEILGAAAHKSFADAVEDRFFLPLGMVSAGYGAERLTGAKDWARPHRGRHVQPVKEAYWRVPGWRNFTYAGLRLQGHSGAVSGYRATMIFEPATRTGVVALWNSDWGFPFRIPFAALDSYHKRADAAWLDLSELPKVKGAPVATAPSIDDSNG